MKLYDCCLCQKRYIQKGSLKRHLVSVHRKRYFNPETNELVKKSEFDFIITKEIVDVEGARL